MLAGVAASSDVPTSLKRWFVFHFFADSVFAVPLLLFPNYLMAFLGWTTIDPLTARLVGAALFGIGTESWLGRNAPLSSFHTMLRLKIMWSLAANFAIAISLYQGAPPAAWIFQGIFAFFSVLWIYYKLTIPKL